MIFKVFQIPIEENEALLISAHGWKGAAKKSPRIHAFLESVDNRNYRLAYSMNQHVHVASIDCNTLEDTFKIGHFGPEDHITRHATFHPISAGDVIQTPAGRTVIITPFGFEDV